MRFIAAVNRKVGRVVAFRSMFYLRVRDDNGVVEALWVDGSYRPICPEGAPAPLPEPRIERVLVFMLEDGSFGPVHVQRIPPDWDQDDIDRYVNGDVNGVGIWDRCAMTDLQEVSET